MNYEQLITSIRENHRIKDPQKRFLAMLPLLARAASDAPIFGVKYFDFYAKQAFLLNYPQIQFKIECVLIITQMRQPTAKIAGLDKLQNSLLDYIGNLRQKKDTFNYYYSIATTLINIGEVLRNKDIIRQALKNLQKITSFIEQRLVGYNDILNYYTVLTNTLTLLGQTKQARACADYLIDLVEDTEQYNWTLADANSIKAECFCMEKNFDAALSCIELVHKSLKSPAITHAHAYYLQAQALVGKKKQSKAISALFCALEIGKYSFSQEHKINIYSLLVECFEQQKDYQQALHYQKLKQQLEEEARALTYPWLYKFWYQMLEKYSIADGVTYTVWDDWAQVQQSQSAQEQQFIKKMLENLQQQIGSKNYGVQELALDMDLSERQLSRKIIQHFGLSPLQLMRQIRIDLAKQMLSAKMWTVQEIADYLGFSSASYFIRSFKEAAGCTPSEYAP